MKIPAHGSCQCGNIQYRIDDEPLATYACHCLDCQKLSTSAFSVTLLLQRRSFSILSGELKSWERATDSGGKAICWFCPTCGNRIFHESPAFPDLIRFKPGTLDDTSELKPQVHLWTCREQAWLKHSADLPRLETQPDLASAAAALAQGKSPF